jgi:hypothetical protein
MERHLLGLLLSPYKAFAFLGFSQSIFETHGAAPPSLPRLSKAVFFETLSTAGSRSSSAPAKADCVEHYP